MQDVKVTLDFSSKNHSFDLKVDNVKEVSYIIRYASKQTQSEQAFTGKGKANAKGMYTVQHVAGTESSGTFVYHDVTDGVVEVTAKTPDQYESKVTQNFSVDAKGKLRITSSSTESDSAASVLGASTDSARLSGNAPEMTYENTASPFPEFAEEKKVAVTPAPVRQATTQTSDQGMFTKKNFTSLSILGVTILVTIASVAILARRMRSQQ